MSLYHDREGDPSTPAATCPVCQQPWHRAVNPLTPRQRAVVDLVARGQTNREIAANLCIAVGTVKGHLHAVFGLLKLKTRFELLRWAWAAELSGGGRYRGTPVVREGVNGQSS
jgi:DNA-binding NarL/FixJ family response regulator